jgi:hypothetical protein
MVFFNPAFIVFGLNQAQLIFDFSFCLILENA